MLQLDDVYNKLRNIEQTRFPIPRIHEVVRVGTFDAANGRFSFDPRVKIVRHVDRITHVPDFTHTLAATAVDVGLEFSVVNRQGNFDVSTFAGPSVSAPPDQNTVVVELGTSASGDFTVTSGSKSFDSDLDIARPTVIGAGAFTIPALPLTIVYDLPVDRG